MSTAILLIAHGSRNTEANDDLRHVVAELRRRGSYEIVEPAFLELAEPTIEMAARRCVERGAVAPHDRSLGAGGPGGAAVAPR